MGNNDGRVEADDSLSSSTVQTVELDRAQIDGSPVSGELRGPTIMANALGAAWATYQLFHDPLQQDAFVWAVEELSGAEIDEMLEVGRDSFAWRGQLVPSQSSGTGRLVERLFLHDVAAIRFVRELRPEDVLGLFEVLRRERAEVEADGGAREALVRAGIQAVSIIDKSTLTDDESESEGVVGARGRPDSDEYSGDPEALAAALLSAADGDPKLVAAKLVEAYDGTVGSVAEDDHWAHQEIIHTFVDMFFYFPRDVQAAVLPEVLARREIPRYRMFLDQFAHQELSELAPLLPADVHPLLLEYAKIADENSSAPAAELENLIAGTPDSASDAVSDRIDRLLHTAEPAEEFAAARPSLDVDAPEPAAIGRKVLLALLELSDESQDQRRLLRVWAGKVAEAVEHDDPQAALEWLESVEPDDFPPDGRVPREALIEFMRPGLVSRLVGALHTDDDPAMAAALLEALGTVPVESLLELLAGESDLRRRRTLIEMLTELCTEDADPVLRRLDDPRWYFVRNLVVVLGRSRDPRAAAAVVPLTTHPDDRVRREALRSLHMLGSGEDVEPIVEALADPAPNVRRAAATILRSLQVDNLVEVVSEMLKNPIDTNAKADALTLLGAVRTDEARKLLGSYASRRIVGRGEARTLRAAARRALGWAT